MNEKKGRKYRAGVKINIHSTNRASTNWVTKHLYIKIILFYI